MRCMLKKAGTIHITFAFLGTHTDVLHGVAPEANWGGEIMHRTNFQKECLEHSFKEQPQLALRHC